MRADRRTRDRPELGAPRVAAAVRPEAHTRAQPGAEVLRRRAEREVGTRAPPAKLRELAVPALQLHSGGRQWPRRGSNLRVNQREGARGSARSPGPERKRHPDSRLPVAGRVTEDSVHPKVKERAPAHSHRAVPSYPAGAAVAIAPTVAAAAMAEVAGPKLVGAVAGPKVVLADRLEPGPIAAGGRGAPAQPTAAALPRERDLRPVPRRAAAQAAERELRTIGRTCSSADSERHSERRQSCENSGEREHSRSGSPAEHRDSAILLVLDAGGLTGEVAQVK